MIQFEPGSVKKATAGLTSADLWKAPIDTLRVYEGFNVRDKDKAYDERVRYIANSIKANGYMTDKPIAGYTAIEDGEHVIILTDGHTRYAAVKLAISEGCEITEVPVVTKPRGTSMEDLTVALVTSNSGERLKPFEVAKVCKRLIGYGMDENQIATRLGLTRAYVISLLDLLAAPKAVRDLVSEGRVSATEASKTIKAHGKNAAKVLTDAAAAAPKARITAKDLRKDTVPPLVQKAVKWIVDNETIEGEDMDAYFGLVAHLSGVDQLVVGKAADEYLATKSL